MEEKVNKAMNDFIRGKQPDSHTEQTPQNQAGSSANAGSGTGRQIRKITMSDLIRMMTGR